ncbi:MAG: hypothetical protein E6I38_07350 [Chloroflexi bacterium]|nr:MAG: hypothetical protein E6I38_07350 [Chloroflexota bacterium]
MRRAGKQGCVGYVGSLVRRLTFVTLRPLAAQSARVVVAFNEGQQTHTLTIDALGVDREFPPSDTQEFSLPLKKAGEFKVYCRFHRDNGMTATLKVSE